MTLIKCLEAMNTKGDVLPQTMMQISDCHLGNQKGDKFLGLDADESLKLVLDMMGDDLYSTELLVCSGDLGNEAGEPAFKRLLEALPKTIKQAWLPGNHDDNDAMADIIADKHQFLSSSVLGNWQITLLDTSIPKKVPGLIAADELQRAVNVLEQFPERHHIIFLHHHLLPIGCQWLDWQAVANADEVLETLVNYPQLKAIMNGHVHQANHKQYGHIDLYATPSTSIQFKTNSDDFALDVLMPGYRSFVLHDDGRLDTQVHRIAQHEFYIDHKPGSY